ALSLRALAQQLGIEFVEDLAARPASAQFLEKIPIAFARRHGILGLAGGDDGSPNGDVGGQRVVLVIATKDLSEAAQDVLQVVGRFLGRPVRPLLAPESAIASAINVAYQQK